MTSPTLLSLAGRVESLTRTCRETDALIDVACRVGPGANFPAWVYTNFPTWRARVGGRVEVVHQDGTGGVHWTSKPFTGSLDAAMTLVPERHGFYFRRNCSADGEVVYCNAQVWPFSDPRDDEAPHYWANSPEDAPALALVAACLKARSALEASHD